MIFPMSKMIEIEEIDQKFNSKIMKKSEEKSQNDVEILQKISIDLKKLHFLIFEQLQNINQNLNRNRNQSEWEILADHLETFFMIFFLFANPIITIIFLQIGHSKQ